MRNCLEGYYFFIDSCHDPYAAKIRYHPMCWTKYITYKERDIPLQKVRQTEVRILMLKHVKEVIFVSNEPRSLKCLVDDYNILLTNYNMDKITRVTTVKEMLQEEFGNNIGFHERIHKNKSIIVYNKADC